MHARSRPFLVVRSGKSLGHHVRLREPCKKFRPLLQYLGVSTVFAFLESWLQPLHATICTTQNRAIPP